MGWVIVCAVIVWLISPIPLGILALSMRSKLRRQKDVLYFLRSQNRITDADLNAAGLPQVKQPAGGVQQMQAFSGQGAATVQPNAETALETAAARAEAIAEAALTAPEEAAAEIAPEEAAAEAAPEEAAAEIAPEEAAAEIAPEEAAAETAPAEAAEAPVFPYPAAVQEAAPEKDGHISAITVMLSVGVALIIIAGLIFVRSQWDTMGAFGKLTTLAAGSVLFFGTSALARRVWHLERTGMAFFTLGAVFLPISVWAAGCFELLGRTLSDAQSPLLIALSFAAFTPIALYAAVSYRKLGWGIAAVTGGALAYYFAAYGFAERLSLPEHYLNPVGLAVLVLAAAIPAPLLTFNAPGLKKRIKAPLDRIPEPFAICFACVSAALTFTCFSEWEPESGLTSLYAAAFFLAAAAMLAPCVRNRAGDFVMIPVTGLLLPGLGLLLYPVYTNVIRTTEPESGAVLCNNIATYYMLLCAICAAVYLLLLLAKLVPEKIKNGTFVAAYALSAAGALLIFFDITHVSVIMAVTLGVLLLIWLYAAVRRPGTAVSILIAELSCVFAVVLTDLLYNGKHFGTELLLIAGAMLALFVIFAVTKKHRTDASDLLFTLLPGVLTAFACNFSAGESPLPVKWTAWGVLLAMVPVYRALALAHDTKKDIQYVFAVLTPLALAGAALSVAKVPLYAALIAWTVLSAAIGFVTYATTKGQFHSVRRTLFFLTVLPPLAAGFFSPGFEIGKWTMLHQLICIGIAFGLWRLTANRGFKKLSLVTFGTLLLLTLDATYLAMRDQFFRGRSNFSVLMVTAVWILLLSLLAAAIGKRMVMFVGSDSVANVMSIAAPAGAMLLSGSLLSLEKPEWAPFCFLYTVLVCAAAWFSTKKTQVIPPCICMAALMNALESLRVNLHDGEDTTVMLLLIGMLVMTVLFPYLGTVLRETPDGRMRSWSLTMFGGAVPLWLVCILTILIKVEYTHAQRRWMLFFVPVMLAAYMLHFVKMTENPARKRMILAASAACGMIAFWLQPLFDVKDTFFAGKLHILPLVGFGVVIRKLYGRELGGKFLFGAGCYAMLRLGIGAAVSENPADLLTVLAVGLMIFVASFYVRQKKWFLLGGISLLTTGIYMHMKLTDGRQWWVYLLLTGLVLIVVAATNETLKQRGDSLKSKAGRLWNDWTW